MENITCTFFGHKDCPASVKGKLKDVLEELILSGVKSFYVGHQGNFDRYVQTALKELKCKYPHIDYAVVLAYLPTSKTKFLHPTVFPAGIESVPLKYAISWRNKWLISHSSLIVAYAKYPGNTARFVEDAKKQGKTVLNIAE